MLERSAAAAASVWAAGSKEAASRLLWDLRALLAWCQGTSCRKYISFCSIIPCASHDTARKAYRGHYLSVRTLPPGGRGEARRWSAGEGLVSVWRGDEVMHVSYSHGRGIPLTVNQLTQHQAPSLFKKAKGRPLGFSIPQLAELV